MAYDRQLIIIFKRSDCSNKTLQVVHNLFSQQQRNNMIRSTFHLLSVLALVVTYTHGFTVGHNQQPARVAASTRLFEGAAPVDMEIDMPPTNSGLQANLRLKPVLSVPSEMIEVRYKIPFGLNVEPKNQLAVVTADGPGGEKVGDVLRYTSQWTMGLPKGDGIISTAASFSGGVSWQCTLFNVVNAGSWEQVVEALTSNVESRTDEIVMIFERPLEPAPELA